MAPTNELVNPLRTKPSPPSGAPHSPPASRVPRARSRIRLSGWVLAFVSGGTLLASPGPESSSTPAADPEIPQREIESQWVGGDTATARTTGREQLDRSPGDWRLRRLVTQMDATLDGLDATRERLTREAADTPAAAWQRALLATNDADAKEWLDRASAGGSVPTWATAVERARWALAHGAPERARSHLDALGSKIPEVVAARTLAALAIGPTRDASRVAGLSTGADAPAPIHFARAEIALDHREHGQAQKEIERGRHLSPADVWGMELQTRLELAKGQADRALEALQSFRRVWPLRLSLVSLDIEARRRSGRIAPARELLQRHRERWQQEDPADYARHHAWFAWRDRDPAEIRTALSGWPRQSRFERERQLALGRLAGLTDDLGALDGVLTTLEEADDMTLNKEHVDQLRRLRDVLVDAEQRRADSRRFVSALCLALVAVAMGLAWSLRRRRAQATLILLFATVTAGCNSTASLQLESPRLRLEPERPAVVVLPVRDERVERVTDAGAWWLVPGSGPQRQRNSHPERMHRLAINPTAEIREAIVGYAAYSKLFSGVSIEEEPTPFELQLEPKLVELSVRESRYSYRAGALATPVWILGFPWGRIRTRVVLDLTLRAGDGTRLWEHRVEDHRIRLQSLYANADSASVIAADVSSILRTSLLEAMHDLRRARETP